MQGATPRPALVVVAGDGDLDQQRAVGFLFTFYDIFDINVSFIQTCVQLKAGCSPQNALDSLSFPVLMNLVGYVVGTLVLSPVADRIGRFFYSHDHRNDAALDSTAL